MQVRWLRTALRNLEDEAAYIAADDRAAARLVVGRVLHAIGLTRTAGVSFGRFVGSAASWMALLVLSLWSLWAFARTLLA